MHRPRSANDISHGTRLASSDSTQCDGWWHGWVAAVMVMTELHVLDLWNMRRWVVYIAHCNSTSLALNLSPVISKCYDDNEMWDLNLQICYIYIVICNFYLNYCKLSNNFHIFGNLKKGTTIQKLLVWDPSHRMYRLCTLFCLWVRGWVVSRVVEVFLATILLVCHWLFLRKLALNQKWKTPDLFLKEK